VQFWNPRTPPSSLREEDALRRFDELLESATVERLVADVPVGVFLSGGIDSSTVAYYAAKSSSKKIRTFSIGFKEKSYDESDQARLVAQRLDTEHHEQILSAKDALGFMDELPRVFDEPVADASVLPTLLLSRFTRGEVTVALGGDGADELLLGYPTFVAERYAAAYARVPERLRTLLRHGADSMPASSDYMSLGFKARKFTHDFDPDLLTRHLQWLGTFKETEFPGVLSPAVADQAQGVNSELIEYWRKECPELTGLNALSHFYLRTYLLDQVLVKVDRASMHFALEVRAPFLSRDLMEFLLSLPPEMKFRSGHGKYLLRKLMRGRLPDSILDQKKKGFAAPVAQWLRGDLRPLATDLLSPAHLRQGGLFNPETISKLLEEHLDGSQNHAKKLWTLLVFQLWHDHWMK
jgi:asparagine synthase (glutamine-hydrolysing)